MVQQKTVLLALGICLLWVSVLRSDITRDFLISFRHSLRWMNFKQTGIDSPAQYAYIPFHPTVLLADAASLNKQPFNEPQFIYATRKTRVVAIPLMWTSSSCEFIFHLFKAPNRPRKRNYVLYNFLTTSRILLIWRKRLYTFLLSVSSVLTKNVTSVNSIVNWPLMLATCFRFSLKLPLSL